ncbi:MAG: multifunctional CCA addition/repair protein [Gammaproteobacteria bacterium]|nr:multifunctional CCA addition/repair protein [Gammaproteobacteria bacterium]
METVYLVGGAVRDQLLGLPVQEKDYVVVGTTPDALRAKGYKPVGKDFPVFLHPHTKEEYALARTERKTGKGYTGFVFHADPSVTLEEDLKRRDLTINAMAMDEQGHIIDPFHGKQDLENKLLRHVSDAFVEDPVRILRIARFAARYASLGFTIAEETKALMKKMVRAGEINALVPERVWQEWQLSFSTSAPQVFLQVLRECGALNILFPEIDALFGVPAPPQYHAEIDTGIHTFMVVAYAASLHASPIVCFAALLHDLGKGNTLASAWPAHHDHEKRSLPLIKTLCQRYKVPKDYQALALLVAEYHTHIHRAQTLKAATLLTLFEKTDAFRRPERFELLLLACEADFFGRNNVEEKTYPQKTYLLTLFNKIKSIPINTHSIKNRNGDQIKEKIREQRLQEIKKFIALTAI